MKYSVVIPVYKNKDLFIKNLKKNIVFLQNCEIIVVDDHSQEDIAMAVLKIDKKIIVIENSSNVGFGRSMNIGVAHASCDIVVFLNSDVILKGFFEKECDKALKNRDIFAVSFMQEERDGKKVGKNIIRFRHGFPQHARANNADEGFNAWAEGGACAVKKDYFLKLGGFTDLYAPFYWEDVDLSYRAYAKGWKVLFCPDIEVSHHHESTIRKYYTISEIETIAFRNQLIFTWINISDVRMLISHAVFLPIYLIKNFIKGKTFQIKGFFSALGKIKGIVRQRRKNISDKIIGDRDIMNYFHHA